MMVGVRGVLAVGNSFKADNKFDEKKINGGFMMTMLYVFLSRFVPFRELDGVKKPLDWLNYVINIHYLIPKKSNKKIDNKSM